MNVHAEMWADSEIGILDLFVEHPESTEWEIADLLSHHGVASRPQADFESLTLLLADLITYINREVSRNSNVFAPDLTRPGRYPIVRQIRDVHQFDVGGHLAATHALAVRHAPIAFAAAQGLSRLGHELDGYAARTSLEQLSATAIFHDIFKALRPRRILPSKSGSAVALTFQMPDGSDSPEGLNSVQEADLIRFMLPYFAAGSYLEGNVIEIIRRADQVGAAFYRLLDSSPEQLPNLAGTVANEMQLGKSDIGGIYQAVCDFLGKGFAIYVVTSRKGRHVSLHDAAVALLRAVDQVI